MIGSISSLSLDTAMENLRAAQTKMATANSNRIDKTATDFTAMFMSQMMQPMVESVQVDETFGGGHGEQIMRSFMVQEYGRIIANTENLDFTKSIKAELLKLQEQSRSIAS